MEEVRQETLSLFSQTILISRLRSGKAKKFGFYITEKNQFWSDALVNVAVLIKDSLGSLSKDDGNGNGTNNARKQ